MIKRGKKRAFAIALTPIFILVILEILRDFYWTEQVFFWIRILFLLLITIPVLLGYVAIFSSKLRKSKWLTSVSDFMPVYYGFVIMLISFNTDIIPKMGRWDISMTGLGIALIALGIAYFMQQEQKPFLEELNNKIDKIEKTVSKLQPTKTRGKKQRK